MTSSSPVPKLPIWVFFATDAVLIATAVAINAESKRPLSQTATLAIVGCIFVGILVLCVPLIAYYERQKNEMLDDRQRALESLARTVAASAEQISIAANGLHEIAELAQKNLRHAEQLPHKLQEKIAEFQAQLSNANDAEKEELEKELEELRASESERLQTASDKIARAAAEFAKVEATTNQHLAAANDAVGKLAFTAAGAIGKAQAAAEQAFSHARQEAAKSVGDATGQAIKSIESAKAAAVADIAQHFDANVERLKQIAAQLSAETDKLAAVAAKPLQVEPAPASAAPALPPAEAAAATATSPAASETAAPASEPLTAPPKRPRKVRREEPPPAPETATAATPPTPEATAPAAAEEPPPSSPIAAAPAEEPAPIPAEKIAEIAPVAPHTTEPFAPPPEVAPETAEATPAAVEPPKPPRKRPAKKTEDEQPALGLEIDEPKSNGAENAEDASGGPGVVERVLTSDGATRLIVTAYIGIGNRLFIRGNGPGLSWDKGVPLQFVSIGKWRWETNEANAPVEFKLLKNDEQECAGLGALTIEPGHQHEVTANFS